uniref:Gene duplicate 1-A/1-B protein n=1 Tax=Capnocytophaga canimorsus TaxID=28188 RepID=A0A1X7BYU4_9FLAO|nr:Gene duplicate 1-A/1-B protein [Capnocytophaga canimorsus]
MNKYLKKIQPYTLTSHKVWEISPKDEKFANILKLDWNEATIAPTPLVKEYISKFLNNYHLNWYPDVRREEILDRLAKYVELPKDFIQYFSSSDAIHEYIATMLLSTMSKVLILGPTYDNFRLTCQSRGAEVVFFQFEKDFSFDAHSFRKKIQEEKPTLVYICNPNNPTGYLHNVEYIEALLKEFKDSIFLIDEAYFEFSGISCKDLIQKYSNIIITRTFSKAFAIANFRIGYMLAPIEIIKTINLIRNPKNISSCTQQAAIAVLDDIGYMRSYVEEVNKSKSLFIDQLQRVFQNIAQVYSSSGNFILIDFHSLEEKNRFLFFLEENSIFVRNLSFSYRQGYYVRVTIGTKEQMDFVLKVIKKLYE